MASPERPEQNLHSSKAAAFFQRKLDTIYRDVADPSKRAKRTKRTQTFHVSTDPETTRRLTAPPLVPAFSIIRVDSEGIPQLLRWQRAQIPPQYKILGLKEPQRGRNYAQNPPKTKTMQKLVPVGFPQGIDVLLRTAERVRDKYRLEKGVRNEASQAMVFAEHFLKVQHVIENFHRYSADQLQEIAREMLAFLRRYGQIRPQNEQKKTMQTMIRRGFRDARGQINFLAWSMRHLAAVRALAERQEIAIPETSEKYARIAERAAYTRATQRSVIRGAIRSLSTTLRARAFTTPALAHASIEVRRRIARPEWEYLYGVFRTLRRHVRVRPYVLGARKAIEEFGSIKLPEGTISRRNQERRRADALTITDELRAGEFGKAREHIQRIQRMLQRILDVHEDYQTTKLSKRRKDRPSPSERLRAYMVDFKGMPEEEFSRWLAGRK